MNVAICKKEKTENGKIAKLFTYVGLKKAEVEEIKAGDIVALSGISDINIGDTICDVSNPEKIPFVDIDEPTVSMTFSVNDGPFAGREGTFVTSRHLRDRLFKELDRNVSLRVKETDRAESFEVSGRGELHLSVLIETMRREGFELLVSRPKVIIKEIDGVKCEPIERLVVNVPDDCIGNVIEKLGRRKGEMVNMEPAEAGLRLSLTSSTSLAGQDRMAPLREVASSPAHPSRGRVVAMASRTSSLPDLLEGHRTMPLPIRTVIPDHSPARDRATECPATSLSADRRHTGTMTYHFDI